MWNRFKHSKWTVCDELTRQGYLSEDELERDKSYGGANYSHTLILVYRVLIVPVVALMKLSWPFTHLVYSITSKLWLSKALK
jgi:hypothetical protein